MTAHVGLGADTHCPGNVRWPGFGSLLTLLLGRRLVCKVFQMHSLLTMGGLTRKQPSCSLAVRGSQLRPKGIEGTADEADQAQVVALSLGCCPSKLCLLMQPLGTLSPATSGPWLAAVQAWLIGF